jgi:hypothetical protein
LSDLGIDSETAAISRGTSKQSLTCWFAIDRKLDMLRTGTVSFPIHFQYVDMMSQTIKQNWASARL